MEILVTGCAGFIGSNLIDKLLDMGTSVVGIDNFDNYYNKSIKLRNIRDAQKNTNFTFYEGDIRNKDFIKMLFNKYDFDMIFHMAARPGVRSSIKYPELYNNINAIGTLKLLEACINTNIKKFVFASSSSVYGNYKYIPIDENHPTNPISPYGISKLTAEKYCLFFDEVYGIKCLCLRIFTAYGKRQRPDEAICRFVNNIFLNKEIRIYGDGNQKRDFTYIDDVINAFILTLKTNTHKLCINIGNGKSVSINDIVSIVKGYGKNIKVIYEDERIGDVRVTLANIDLAKKILGYEPKIDIKEGIRRFVEWVGNNRDYYN